MNLNHSTLMFERTITTNSSLKLYKAVKSFIPSLPPENVLYHEWNWPIFNPNTCLPAVMTTYSFLSSSWWGSMLSCTWGSWSGLIRRHCKISGKSPSMTQLNYFQRVSLSSSQAIRLTNSLKATRCSYNETLLGMTPMDPSENICSLMTSSFPSTLNYGCMPMALCQPMAGLYAACNNTFCLMSVATPWEQGVLLP